MRDLPHLYAVTAVANPEGDVLLGNERLPRLPSAPPAEFDGPGDRWSPETLIAAAVADCFVLTFRAVAKFSKLPWVSLTCSTEATLDRLDRVMQFTAFTVRAHLQVPAGTNLEQAKRLMTRAEQACLISNSLKAGVHLEAEVEIVRAAEAA